jgi:ATP-binding cassette subfamily B protein
MQTKPSIASPENPSHGKKSEYAVEIRNLSFKYPDSTEALSEINVQIRHGYIVGILGRTGSGKSTLIKTLTRTVDPPAGTVFVDGTDVREWDVSELRGRFGVTPQDSYLFSDSIKHNIGYSIEEENEALLKKAAAISAIDRDVEDFRSGWETVIGERGTTLSGGQKQRVAMARALATNPDILILDDSLSAVDAETERRILDALLAERFGKTTIIISHRVSTLRNADFVIVLDQGKIAESGTHQYLLNNGGFYARAAELQELD